MVIKISSFFLLILENNKNNTVGCKAYNLFI